MRPSRLLAFSLATVVLLAGCGGDPEPAPSPSPSPSPSPTPDEPSPGPTEQTVPAPLTGEAVAPEVVERPVVAVKIENTAKARPQSGLEVADIVYEQLVEGGGTRFLALFHSRVPERVGPVRSARLVDAEVLAAYDGALAFSGARDEVDAALARSGIGLLGDDGVLFSRDPSRDAPSNLFAEGSTLFDAAAELEGVTAPAPFWRFSEEPPAGGSDGARIDIRMSGAAVAGWTHDPETGVYRRDQGGEPSTVTGTGRIGAANVVQLGLDVGLGGCCDAAGSRYVVTDVTGEGDALVLRDGRAYRVRWIKDGAGAHLSLVDQDGAPFPLKPGATWIHLAPASNLPPAASQ